MARLSRVASSLGDRTQFSYGLGPLFEARFARFLGVYHALLPIRPEELHFLREAYRFFLLNYVIRDGENFFQPELCERLRREAIEAHLPALAEADFAVLQDAIASR